MKEWLDFAGCILVIAALLWLFDGNPTRLERIGDYLDARLEASIAEREQN